MRLDTPPEKTNLSHRARELELLGTRHRQQDEIYQLEVASHHPLHALVYSPALGLVGKIVM